MQLDHIAVAGATLAEATDAVETALGVQLQPGGEHAYFGTHNNLLGLTDGLYIEAIAIDPAAPAPTRPRWFDLDRFKGSTRITNWICQTDDLTGTLDQIAADAGVPVALQRGDLRWQMAVCDDGRLPFDNMHPALIMWQSPAHPSALLASSGCILRRLVVAHPDAAALQAGLVPPLDDARVVFEPGPAALMAEFDTPHGRRVLR